MLHVCEFHTIIERNKKYISESLKICGYVQNIGQLQKHIIYNVQRHDMQQLKMKTRKLIKCDRYK